MFYESRASLPVIGATSPRQLLRCEPEFAPQRFPDLHKTGYSQFLADNNLICRVQREPLVNLRIPSMHSHRHGITSFLRILVVVCFINQERRFIIAFAVILHSQSPCFSTSGYMTCSSRFSMRSNN